MTFRLIFKEQSELRDIPREKYTINDLLNDLKLPNQTIVAKINDEIAVEEAEINENDEIKLIQIIYGG